jgi:hypothetical protein
MQTNLIDYIGETSVKSENDGSITPWLARSWKISPDQRTITFELRSSCQRQYKKAGCHYPESGYEKKIAYTPATQYLVFDEKRKFSLAKRIRKLINKFVLTNEQLEFAIT